MEQPQEQEPSRVSWDGGGHVCVVGWLALVGAGAAPRQEIT